MAGPVDPGTPLPYLVGSSDTGSFAYFPSGAVRRIGNTEKQRLRDELGIRDLQLSGGDAQNAAAISKTLFGV